MSTSPDEVLADALNIKRRMDELIIQNNCFVCTVCGRIDTQFSWACSCNVKENQDEKIISTT
jgi:lipopolysaccharide biosynthesis regulator YciM